MLHHNILMTSHGSNGQLHSHLDPNATQVFATDTTSAINNIDGSMNARFLELERRMTEVEAFTRWVAQVHKEVIDEYVVTTQAKQRMGIEQVKKA